MPDKINEPKSPSNDDTQMVKDKDENTKEYIFQNTKITKTGLFIIIFFLILLVLGVVFSGVWLGN